jgi:hypothetical protein
MHSNPSIINTSLQRGGMYVDNARTYGVASITSLKRGVNKNNHSEAAVCFCGCCFAGTDRAAAARSDAFLRRK